MVRYTHMEKIDFVAIGDITTDAFIELENARVNCDFNDENCKLCVNFGDKIPYKDVVVVRAVGNSPNASVCAVRLGLSSALITNLGDDQNGAECLETLQNEGVGTDFIKVETGKQTNYHYVLRYEAERTILVKHHEYKYEIPTFTKLPQWFYLSSLGENSIPFHHTIAEFVRAHPDIKLAFQPGTFQMKLGAETLKDIYEVSELFFCNKQEAKRILNRDEDDIKALLNGIRALGPKMVVITDGPNGATVFDGSEYWHMPMYPDPAPPVDRTGAGDSFSSTFTVMLAKGMSVPEALRRAPINSMSVVQYIGAQKGLLSLEKIEEWLAKAPAEYEPKQL